MCLLPNGKSVLVIVDYFNRYYGVAFLGSTIAESPIDCVISIFSCLGFLITLKTDNAPQLRSQRVQRIFKRI